MGQLESLLDGTTVSLAMGQKVINIISNLMNADSKALAASANRYNPKINVYKVKNLI